MTRQQLEDFFVNELTAKILESAYRSEVAIRCHLWRMVDEYDDAALIHRLEQEGVELPDLKWLVELSTPLDEQVFACCVAGYEAQAESIAKEIYPDYDIESVMEVK